MNRRLKAFSGLITVLAAAQVFSSPAPAAEKRLVVCQGDKSACGRKRYDLHVLCPKHDVDVPVVSKIYCWDNGGGKVNKLNSLSADGECGTDLYEIICNK
ncbi:hypothetical protein [Mesorhizobium sp.]|uniref:hypothetical protein n=1 Tax=Mesorhizobium sp. TaxID=1871066 RepID=UPI000FE4B53F|nr:hypothetical protein [Mesorhizobium sp.]RWQ64525.1 MAG: hypothetical protein EOS86_19880 [Mesorhizobium sp.]